MIAIDTNIIVRLLTKDDAVQYAASLQLFEAEQIFIPDTVILETEWVLRFAYDFEPQQICAALRKLFGLPNVALSNPYLMAQVLDWHQQGLDFADAFHLAQSQQLPTFKTFDEKLIKAAKNLSSCVVQKP
ncbi:type II toxin-antitoxin system VapC family toxin [Alkalimonas sp. MEB108]|uniref:Type II toxin-antitoxin system VapC family toxin n=1 Tax=Alkalimonas cellulosilytica TaxID=3058395 RepID=A0ABU7J4B6_9GAMM|nr:type II toxin-antitoxin system VapC family toxin [Alkalimonas sp. MEB108]MEE2001346.1 type II toxin-antitoxin system VapC family toxin [Alkalimonas sp. MEB108]